MRGLRGWARCGRSTLTLALTLALAVSLPLPLVYCFDTRPASEYQLPPRCQIGAGIAPPAGVPHMRRGAGELAYPEAAEHREQREQRHLAPGSPMASTPSVRGFGGAARRPKVRDQRPKAVQVHAAEVGGEAQGGEQGGADRRARAGVAGANRWRHHAAPRTPSASTSAHHRAVPPYLGAPAPAVYSIYTL